MNRSNKVLKLSGNVNVVMVVFLKLYFERFVVFEKEMSVAIDAVRCAGALCQAMRESLVSAEMVAKMDKSPVTVADFGAQAIIISAIRRAFPDDLIVAEEDTGVLRGDDVAGKPLDFLQGRTLRANKVVIVTNGLLHEAVLREVEQLIV